MHKSSEYAVTVIGVFFLILKESFTDAEIKRMFRAKKVSGYLKVLGEPNMKESKG